MECYWAPYLAHRAAFSADTRWLGWPCRSIDGRQRCCCWRRRRSCQIDDRTCSARSVYNNRTAEPVTTSSAVADIDDVSGVRRPNSFRVWWYLRTPRCRFKKIEEVIIYRVKTVSQFGLRIFDCHVQSLPLLISLRWMLSTTMCFRLQAQPTKPNLRSYILPEGRLYTDLHPEPFHLIVLFNLVLHDTVTQAIIIVMQLSKSAIMNSYWPMLMSNFIQHAVAEQKRRKTLCIEYDSVKVIKRSLKPLLEQKL